VKVGAQTLRKLQRYPWPGNVRELQHAVERAVVLTDSTTLQPNDFFLAEREPAESLELKELTLDGVEKDVIMRIITKHRGNITHAAKELGLTRAALYRRLEKHGL
jgi:DNA-binding NtrC family response regulator